jgi:hypothetical protein
MTIATRKPTCWVHGMHLPPAHHVNSMKTPSASHEANEKNCNPFKIIRPFSCNLSTCRTKRLDWTRQTRVRYHVTFNVTLCLPALTRPSAVRLAAALKFWNTRSTLVVPSATHACHADAVVSLNYTRDRLPVPSHTGACKPPQGRCSRAFAFWCLPELQDPEGRALQQAATGPACQATH